MYVGGLIIHLPQVWCTTSDSISPLLFLHPLSEGCGTRLTNPNYSETSKLVYTDLGNGRKGRGGVDLSIYYHATAICFRFYALLDRLNVLLE